MYAIGIDIGTTSICGVVVEDQTGRVVHCATLKGPGFLPTQNVYARVQDARVLAQQAMELAQQLSERFAPCTCIGVTGQMHGIVYIDAKGALLSPLYTWQDSRGLQRFDAQHTYAQELARRTGITLAPGYGALTHFYNLHHGLVPHDTACFCTIHAYVAMRLAQRTRPVLHATDGAGIGLYQLEEAAFSVDAINAAQMPQGHFPQVVSGFALCGQTAQGIPVAAAIGDNQAGFFGSVADNEKTVMVNVGTSGQVSLHSKRAVRGAGECRPHVDGGYLLAGATLCGGRSYALLEQLFCQIVTLAGGQCDSLFEAMNRCAATPDSLAQPLSIDTRFCGTREHPDVRGSIAGISEDNLTPRHLIDGVLNGIVTELLALYHPMRQQTGATPDRLVVAGNALRKNQYLQQLFAKRFDMLLHLCAHTEEAAFGAALYALAASGRPLNQVRQLIQYQSGGGI